MLLLMPHVDNQNYPPLMEIQAKEKNPAGIEETDVVGKSPQQPIVLLLGCGAATSSGELSRACQHSSAAIKRLRLSRLSRSC